MTMPDDPAEGLVIIHTRQIERFCTELKAEKDRHCKAKGAIERRLLDAVNEARTDGLSEAFINEIITGNGEQ